MSEAEVVSRSAKIRPPNQGAATKEYQRYFTERQRRVAGRGPAIRLATSAEDN